MGSFDFGAPLAVDKTKSSKGTCSIIDYSNVLSEFPIAKSAIKKLFENWSFKHRLGCFTEANDRMRFIGLDFRFIDTVRPFVGFGETRADNGGELHIREKADGVLSIAAIYRAIRPKQLFLEPSSFPVG